MSMCSMSHFEFTKRPCRPVDFKGQGPYLYVGVPGLVDCGQVEGGPPEQEVLNHVGSMGFHGQRLSCQSLLVTECERVWEATFF